MSSKKADVELVLDPASDEVKAAAPEEAAAIHAAAKPQAPAGTPLKRLFFPKDANTPDTYRATVVIEGLTVNVDLLDDAELIDYTNNEQAIEKAARSVMDLTDNGKILETVKATNLMRRDKIDALIREKVKGFNGQKASEEDRLGMSVPDKKKICTLIYQKSEFGHDESDFLEKR